MSFSTFFKKAHPLTPVTVALDTEFDPPIQLLYVGIDGDIKMKINGNTAVTYVAVPAGTWISLPITEIIDVGTTGAATDFIGHR